MNISDIQAQWEQDNTIDEARLTHEAVRIPKIHHKYLKMLFDEKNIYEQICIEYDTMVHFKTLYYTGKLDETTLKEKGMQPFHFRLLKQDVEMYLRADSDINRIRERKTFQMEKVNFLEEVIKQINQRNFHLRLIIDWQKFTSGTG